MENTKLESFGLVIACHQEKVRPLTVYPGACCCLVSLMLDTPFAVAQAAHMYSGARTGLVLTDIQREQQELKKRDQETVALEGKNVKM